MAKITALLLAGVLAMTPVVAHAGGAKSVHVSGYTRKDGTYVASHYRSAPGGGSSSYSSGSSYSSSSYSTPRTAVRTAPVTEARTVARYPTVSDPVESAKETELARLRKIVADAEARRIAEESFGRMWTDARYGLKFRAEFLAYRDGKAELRKLGGEEIAMPSINLSVADQDWIKAELKRRHGK